MDATVKSCLGEMSLGFLYLFLALCLILISPALITGRLIGKLKRKINKRRK